MEKRLKTYEEAMAEIADLTCEGCGFSTLAPMERFKDSNKPPLRCPYSDCDNFGVALVERKRKD